MIKGKRKPKKVQPKTRRLERIKSEVIEGKYKVKNRELAFAILFGK